MGVIEVLLVAILLYVFYSKGKSIVKASESKITIKAEEPEEETSIPIVKERMKNARLINECLSQMNSSSSRRSIVEWSFKESCSDEILFRFIDEDFKREGKVYFIDDRVQPRVSRIQFMEDGQKKYIKGYVIKPFTQDQLYNKFAKEKQDQRRLAYLNEISMKALIEESELNILKYQGITEKEFTQTFGKKEMKSLIKLLKEEFQEVKTTSVPWILSVTAQDEPQEDVI